MMESILKKEIPEICSSTKTCLKSRITDLKEKTINILLRGINSPPIQLVTWQFKPCCARKKCQKGELTKWRAIYFSNVYEIDVSSIDNAINI